MKKLTIIIVDYQSELFLKSCLESLKKAVTPEGWQKEIIIVDNNKINRGFAKACNLEIKKSLKADAVLLLNPDTVVDQNFLGPLLKNKADIVGPVIKFRRQERWVYDYGGRVNRSCGRTTHIENHRLVNIGDQIDYVSGCAMLIKRKVIEKIGLLDERYFLYFEDVDYCLQAQKAGFKIEVEPKSIITHLLQEKRSYRQKYQLLRNNLRFINRWIPFPRRLMAWAYWKLLVIKVLI